MKLLIAAITLLASNAFAVYLSPLNHRGLKAHKQQIAEVIAAGKFDCTYTGYTEGYALPNFALMAEKGGIEVGSGGAILVLERQAMPYYQPRQGFKMIIGATADLQTVNSIRLEFYGIPDHDFQGETVCHPSATNN